MRRLGELVRAVLAKWSEDDVLAQGAALAFYTLFSLAPMLVLVIAVAGLLYGEKAVRGELFAQLSAVVGPDVARSVEQMLAAVRSPAGGIVASLVSLITMLLGASGAFGHLQRVLRRIFDAPPPPRRGWRGLVRQRLVTFAMVLGVGLLLGASMLLSTLLAGFHGLLAAVVPAAAPLLPWLDAALSLSLMALLFALVFKVLPGTPLGWRQAAIGGAVTSLLFAVGKVLIAVYLARAGGTSVFGAAASVALLLLWIYYSAQIFFLGAEVTAVLARRQGSG